MATNLWLIIAEANLHVGNENVSSYGLIDKAIQRDALTNLPCINSSSLKGALNEYATEMTNLNPTERISIFGVDKGKENSETKKGGSIFFDANLLLLPRQKDNSLYELVTTENILNNFAERATMFGFSLTKDQLKEKLNNTGLKFRILETDKEFKEYCSDDELPIIARNCLENGESKNLWYEQILPQKTVLGTLIISHDNLLEERIKDKIIQIGANATIGFGYCRFVKL